jgi:hypothetical protein
MTVNVAGARQANNIEIASQKPGAERVTPQNRPLTLHRRQHHQPQWRMHADVAKRSQYEIIPPPPPDQPSWTQMPLRTESAPPEKAVPGKIGSPPQIVFNICNKPLSVRETSQNFSSVLPETGPGLSQRICWISEQWKHILEKKNPVLLHPFPQIRKTHQSSYLPLTS